MAWALITGASEGLGPALAQLAAEDRHDLILNARHETLLHDLATRLRSTYGVTVEVIAADLSQESAAARLWAAASTGREIRILVNAAVHAAASRFDDPDTAARDYASVMVNVLSTTVLMKEAVTAMAVGEGGRILNVTSAAALVPGPGMAVYHASQSYLLSLSEAVAQELRGGGITVTALCPASLHSQNLPSAKTLALKGWAAMKEGRRTAMPGLAPRALDFATRIAPRALTLRVTAFFLRRR